MKQELTTDTASRYIEASPESLYAFISDVTRTPEYSPEVVRCSWIKGTTGPAVGARFKAINHAGRVPDWPNKPIVTVAEPHRMFAFERSELGAGTIEWRYLLEAQGTGTLVTESYTVLKQVKRFGWFISTPLLGSRTAEAISSTA